MLHRQLADGLTEELIADLSRVQSLLVISRASAMKLKARTEDIRTIAERIGRVAEALDQHPALFDGLHFFCFGGYLQNCEWLREVSR